MKRRVVITGMGAVTPIGNTINELFEAIKNNQCGIGKITHFDTTDFRVKLAGEVKNLDMEQYFSKRELKFNDRFTQFARIAAKQAVQQANLDMSQENRDRVGVMIGSGIGGIGSIENAKTNLEQRGASRVSPYFIPMALVNLAAGNVAIDHQAQGHCSAVVTACAAGSHAIGDAFHLIRDGYEDVMIAGGSEASITPVAVSGFMSMRALCESDDPSRASIPFDQERSGFVMGEGAGVLVLESLEHALQRKATILGEICGYGSVCDAFHITAPSEGGIGGAKAMMKAMADASIEAKDITYINAHGTSTPLNDKTETQAVKLAFKEQASKVMMSSTKSHMGHLLGASGAVEAIITLLSLSKGFIPATIHHQVKDDDCDLDIVANQPRRCEYEYAMSNSLGFGGHNASLIFKKWRNENDL